MKICTVVLLLALSLSSVIAKEKDTLPLNVKTGGQFIDPATTEQDNLIGKQQTPSVKKKKAETQKKIEQVEEVDVDIKPYVATLSIFGTKRLNDIVLKKTLGKELDVWISQGLKGDEASLKLEEKLAKKIRDKFGFVFAKWSVVQFFEVGDMPIHITLDVVEKTDATRRMSFLDAPKGEFQDPDSLIGSWSEYEKTSLDLIESGELKPETEKCQAFHCPFGHTHEKLKKYGKLFVDGVKKNFDKLVEIQVGDRLAEYRAAATYLLAYHTEGKKVVALIVEKIRDPEELVRNNALRVLGDISEFHPELVIPTAPIVQALSFPRVSDRSKSVFIAHMLVLNSQSARNEMLKTAVPSLLDLLAAKMPDQREFSHDVLRKISGKEYPPTDSAAWNNWYSKLPKEH